MRIGASAYIAKQAVVGEIRSALHEVFAGRYYISPLLRSNIPASLYDPRKNPSELFEEQLTPRQKEVLKLVAEGKSNKEIAGVLDISIKTVDFHKAGIMQELGLHSAAELTRYAINHGIVQPHTTAG